ncbi:unnamed protein product [Spirodela intermedia]|uniref:non-specific serine/threonine protein kinase n=1 Tax=Spirodela intermedia TaxID=51605 RepID=A0A7I8K7V9_SPIIN|nr:unnamed protein product [Spirodela intermedia]
MDPITVWRALLLLFLLLELASSDDSDFVFNGFSRARGNLSMDGMAEITLDGLLRLTNGTNLKGQAFYSAPLQFKKSPAGRASSFSSTFVFGILAGYSQLSGNGIAFVISPSKDLRRNFGYQYLGILSPSTDGNSTNHLVAVELDTIYNPDLADINDNHVGIDVNSVVSINSSAAGYFANGTDIFKNLSLISGDPMQVWIDFDGTEMQLKVTLSPLGVIKPLIPLLSSTVNLSEIFLEEMFVGFSSSTGSFSSSHYILGWSFKMNGEARPLNISSLPSLPSRKTRHNRLALALSLSLGIALLLLLAISAGLFVLARKIRYSELLEDWEEEYGPQRFSYKDLYDATRGFKEAELLGVGGFGRVYRGALSSSGMEIAVKKVSHESRQGMKEFIAEIASIGRLRHRNLVQLRGYCRRKGELLLVYDYMPNGSLDKLIFDQRRPTFDWKQRFHVLRGVASGLLYLHEEWEKIVIHRDVKASNVLLDGELNGRLGDFGLARLYDHGNYPMTTHVVGTVGYLAPELTRTGRSTKQADVYAFGALLLETACGRRPIEQEAPEEEVLLLGWVLKNWRKGTILDCADPKLEGKYEGKEMELVLQLGLLCSHPLPPNRPNMRQVMRYLDGDASPPELSSIYLDGGVLEALQNEIFHRINTSSLSSISADAFPLSGPGFHSLKPGDGSSTSKSRERGMIV